MKEKEIIIKTAVFSRCLVIVLQYLSNIIIPDHQADAFHYLHSLKSGGSIDQVINHVFGGFLRWDAQHFMHVAKYGYTYEHSLAFFPLYPMLVRYIALIVSQFLFFVSLDSLILITFVFVNIFFFILSALCLYELSVFVVGKNVAYKATLLFCYNPASIFFTAPYTECLFSYLSFKSMLNCILLYRKYSDIPIYLQVKDVIGIIPICLSTLTRSNGVLNIGFLAYVMMCLCLKHVKMMYQKRDKIYFVKFIVITIFLLLCCIAPFISFQIYSYRTFCNDFKSNLPDNIVEQANRDNFVLPGCFSKHNQSWCFKKLPLAYSYIQAHYWKVGFLQYYEFKQIPNFALALPLVFIIMCGTFNFFKEFPKRIEILFNFHLISENNVPHFKFSPMMAVFIIHAAVLTIFCVLNVHVQVTTRMLCSASPVLYWFCSYHISSSLQHNLLKKKFYERHSTKEYCILGYFLSYFTVGTIMFSNFLPWT